MRRGRLLLSHVCGNGGGRLPATWGFVPPAHGRPALAMPGSGATARIPGKVPAGHVRGTWQHREDHGSGLRRPSRSMIPTRGSGGCAPWPQIPTRGSSHLAASRDLGPMGAARLPQVGISDSRGSRCVVDVRICIRTPSRHFRQCAKPLWNSPSSAHGPTVYTADPVGCVHYHFRRCWLCVLRTLFVQGCTGRRWQCAAPPRTAHTVRVPWLRRQIVTW